MPAGADAVVPIENVVEQDNALEIPSPVEPGANIRPAGGDVRRGEVVVEGGVRLGPPQLAALAAAGVGAVECPRRPRAAVLATGSELRAPGEELGPGQIYEANGLLLLAQLEAAGAEVDRQVLSLPLTCPSRSNPTSKRASPNCCASAAAAYGWDELVATEDLSWRLDAYLPQEAFSDLQEQLNRLDVDGSADNAGRESRNGSAMRTPVPRRNVRREMADHWRGGM